MSSHSFRNLILFNRGFVAMAVVYAICFFITRVSYFLNYDIPGFISDSPEYYQPVLSLLRGEPPIFDLRTPIYPLFLYLCKIFNFSVNGIYFTQSIISITVLVMCQFLFNRHLAKYRFSFFFIAIAFYASSKYLHFNTYIFPISLFTDISILVFTLLLCGWVSNSRLFYVLFSLATAALILTRPQGFYIVPILLLAGVFAGVKKNYGVVISMSAPLIVVLTAFMLYNKLTFGEFTLTRFPVVPKLGSSVLFLDREHRYSPEVEAIIRHIDDSFSPEEKGILKNYWSYSELKKVIRMGNYDKLWEFRSLFVSHASELSRLAANSKKSHPDLYAKFVYTNFINCFPVLLDDYFFYYNELVNRKYAIEQSDLFNLWYFPDDVYELTFAEYTNVFKKKKNLVCTGIIADDVKYMDSFSRENFLIRLNHFYQIAYSRVFSNYIWLILVGISLFYSAIAFARSKFKNIEILALQLPLAIALLNCAIISLSVPPLIRYILPVEFFVFIYPVGIMTYFVALNLKNESHSMRWVERLFSSST